MNNENIVEVKEATKIYQLGKIEVKALDRVNLTVKKGEFISIVGPSGSGKTTLLNLIGALDKLTSGEVIIEGNNISELGKNQLAELRGKTVGFVFQIYSLMPTLTALENVELTLIINRAPREIRKEKPLEYLKRVNLGDRVYHKPMELSGGEQQRVAIARALINDPAIVLADEPTGNVDSKTAMEIVSLMKELNQKQNQTFVVVTHDPNVAKLTTRILKLHDGRIVS